MQNNNQQQSGQSAQQADPGFQSFSFKLEGYLKLLFLVTANLHLPFSFWKALNLCLATIICFLGLTRQNGPLQFNKQYLINALKKEFFQCYFYIIALITLPNPTALFYLPLSLFFGMGLAYFLKYSKTMVSKISYLQKFPDTIITHRADFKQGRAYIELFLFIYSLLMMTKISFMFPLMMFSYLRLRGSFERYSYQSYITLRNEISQKCQGGKITGMLDIVNKKFFNFLTNSQNQLNC